MRTPIPTITELSFQKGVIDYAERMGWKVTHFSDSRRQIAPGQFVGDRQAADFPDLHMVRERVVYAELKGVKGRLRPGQQSMIELLREAGQEVYVWRPSDWAEVESVLRSRRAA